MNLVVLSACYEKPDLSAILRESCALAGLQLRFCAYSGSPNMWPGSMRTGKMVAALEALPRLKDLGFTHVLWADAFDTFFCQREAEIFTRWALKLNYAPMVFSGEKNCWPEPGHEKSYPASDSPWRFINAGTWLGQIDYLQDVIAGILGRTTRDDDQLLWTEAYIYGHLPGAIVDTERMIFQTMWNTELSEVGSPCVIHYNGGIWRNPEDTRYREHWEKVKAGR